MRRYALFALLGVVACGDDASVKMSDAGPGDDSQGAEVDSGPTVPVSITVTVGGDPHAGVTVFFQNADSSLVATKTTDATGTATALMNAGGYVTAEDPYEPQVGIPTKIIRTFGGVKPGDHLLIDYPDPPTQQTIELVGPQEPSIAAKRYRVTTSCGSDLFVLTTQQNRSASGTLTLYNCGAKTDFHIVALDQNNKALSSIYKPDVNVFTTIDLSAEAFVAAPARTFTLNNVPNTVGEFKITDQYASPKGMLGYVTATATGAGTGTTTLTMGAPTFTNASSYVSAVALANRNVHTLLAWGPYAATYSSDAGVRVLKAFESNPAYTATTHAVTWTESTTGVAPDFTYLHATGIRGNEGFQTDWEMITPYASGTATLPKLPVGTYDMNFSDDDALELDVQQLKVSGGYDSVRATFYVTDGPPSATGEASSVVFQPPVQPRTQPKVAPVQHAVPWLVRAH